MNPRFVLPGFEDVWYYLWKERRLPTNVDPFESKLENKEERDRLAKIFEQGLDKIVGYALPLRREHYTDGTGEWVSGSWFFRSERMYLIPGDSPMGYRLPLDSIPWAPASDRPFTEEMDPWADRGPLPARDSISRQRYLLGNPEAANPQGFVEQTLDDSKPHRRRRLRAGRKRTLIPDTDLPLAVGEPAPWIIRTALCAQVRGGVLRIFMPPQRYLEDYLELVSAVEDTANDLELPVLVEGYAPPHDHRINRIKSNPRPRRDRSQHPASRQIGTNWSRTPPPSTRKPISAASAPKNSCSTAATPAPAAATHHHRRRNARRFPAPSPPRPAPQPGRLLAQSSRPFLSVQRHVRRPHQPGPARG